MRIFYLVQMLSPYRVEWMNELAKENSVAVYYMYDKEKSRTSAWLNSCGKSFAAKKLPCVKILNTYFPIGIKKILKKEEFDVYVIDGYSSPVELKAIKWLVKNKKNVFINVDGIDVWRKGGFLDRIKLRVKKKVYAMPVKFLCGSSIAADYIVKNGGKKENVYKHDFTSLKASDIISLEDKIAKQAEYKKKFNVSGKTLIVAAGRFIPLKRYEDLLYAFRDMPDNCVLFLIGGGELKPEYERIIRNEGLKNVELIDFVLSDTLYEYFIAADLFVHTTSTDTWGLVINEAMAKGLPVVCSDRCVAGVELIENGVNGFIYNVGDVNELSSKIKAIINDEELKKSMMANAISRIAPFTVENMAKRHIGIFEKYVKKND